MRTPFERTHNGTQKAVKEREVVKHNKRSDSESNRRQWPSKKRNMIEARPLRSEGEVDNRAVPTQCTETGFILRPTAKPLRQARTQSSEREREETLSLPVRFQRVYASLRGQKETQREIKFSVACVPRRNSPAQTVTHYHGSVTLGLERDPFRVRSLVEQNLLANYIQKHIYWLDFS